MNKARLYIAVVFVALSGCVNDRKQFAMRDQLPSESTATVQHAAYPTTGVDMWDPLPVRPLSSPMSETDDDSVSEDERRKLITVVKNHLELNNDLSEFNVRSDESGYSVFVKFFSLDDQGNKVTFFGGHCLVKLSSDLMVVEVIGGL